MMKSLRKVRLESAKNCSSGEEVSPKVGTVTIVPLGSDSSYGSKLDNLDSSSESKSGDEERNNYNKL